MENPVILSAVRTPIGKFMGGLSPLSAPEQHVDVVPWSPLPMQQFPLLARPVQQLPATPAPPLAMQQTPPTAVPEQHADIAPSPPLAIQQVPLFSLPEQQFAAPPSSLSPADMHGGGPES